MREEARERTLPAWRRALAGAAWPLVHATKSASEAIAETLAGTPVVLGAGRLVTGRRRRRLANRRALALVARPLVHATKPASEAIAGAPRLTPIVMGACHFVAGGRRRR